MITISDNHATNTLIRHLGQGDYQQGIVIINALARKYGFQQTVVRGTHPRRREDVCQSNFRGGCHVIF